MREQIIPGGWYADARPNGEYVVLVPDSHLETHAGRVDLPFGMNLLFPRVPMLPVGFAVAGQLHRESQNAEWTPTRDWRRVGPSYGVSPVIYDRQGRLHQATPAIGSQGYRYVDEAGRLWTGDETYHDRDRRLHEYTVLSGGIVIGQDSDSDRALIVYQGRRHVITDGRTRFIRAQRHGDRIAIAIWREAKRDAFLLWLTVAEIAQLPVADNTTPKPQPVPAPTPEPEPMPVAVDEIDLSAVTFLHTDIREWRITSDLREMRLPKAGEAGIDFRHTKAGKWPDKTLDGTAVEGNPWVLARIGGRWYAATCEWLRPGQTFKPNLSAANLGAHTKVSPLKDWTPQPGEQVGFMVSGLARDKNRNVQERTQVVLVTWPGVVHPQPEPTPPPHDPEPTPEPGPPPTTQHPCDLSTVLARLDLLREDYELLSDAYMAVSQELAEVRKVCEAERPIEINAGWLGTLRGTVGRPKA